MKIYKLVNKTKSRSKSLSHSVDSSHYSWISYLVCNCSVKSMSLHQYRKHRKKMKAITGENKITLTVTNQYVALAWFVIYNNHWHNLVNMHYTLLWRASQVKGTLFLKWVLLVWASISSSMHFFSHNLNSIIYLFIYLFVAVVVGRVPVMLMCHNFIS